MHAPALPGDPCDPQGPRRLRDIEAPWLDMIRAQASAPRLCEVNLNSSRLAFALLCAIPRSTYIGSFYGGWSRHHRLGYRLNSTLSSAFGARARMHREDQWSRSVRGNPLLQACDVVIWHATEVALLSSHPFFSDVQLRLLEDLPSVLLRLRPPPALQLVFAEGAACADGSLLTERVDDALNFTAYEGAAAAVKLSSRTIGDAGHQRRSGGLHFSDDYLNLKSTHRHLDWCSYWTQSVKAGVLELRGCNTTASSDSAW
ncbi:hypothetical protein AB1Y20_007028 [Prymnesium parvum]|uniref:Uncharacterized protein n=1 Tax=Prymnesium parvum TaxID=97485 RepID=A0AB34J2H1_PRYPA